MTERQSHTLAWLGELTQILRVPPDLVIQTVSHDPGIPTLDFGPDLPKPQDVHLPASSDNQENWRHALAELLAHEGWQTCLINLVGIPVHTIETTRDNMRWQDGGVP